MRALRNILLIVPCLLTLSSCSKASPYLPSSPPADLTLACVAMPPFEGQTMDDLVSYTLGLQGDYLICYNRQNALSTWATK